MAVVGGHVSVYYSTFAGDVMVYKKTYTCTHDGCEAALVGQPVGGIFGCEGSVFLVGRSQVVSLPHGR